MHRAINRRLDGKKRVWVGREADDLLLNAGWPCIHIAGVCRRVLGAHRGEESDGGEVSQERGQFLLAG